MGTGGKILFWASDSSEVHLTLGLNIWTRNYVGTIYGGSFFSSSDPFYRLMLMRSLGSNFVEWDKTAYIRFKRPSKARLYSMLKVSLEDLQTVKTQIKESGHITKTFSIRWVDKDLNIYVEIERQCYIADKAFYENRKGETQKARF